MGTTLKQKLQKSNINKKRCGDEKCMVCQTGDGKLCREDGVTYSIKCMECGDVYIGETASNAYTRGLEYASALRNKSKDSALYAHSINKHHHTTTSPVYSMKVTHVYRGDATKRQLSEALMIEKTQTHCQINRRDEFR